MAGIEIERKFVIKKPCIERLLEEESLTSSKITQIYIASEPSVTHRVRRREYADRTRYSETRKTRIDSMSAVEDEREISEEEFDVISENIKAGTRPVTKTRYTFNYGEHIIEIDVYPEWESTCIMEIELKDREEEIRLPDFIEIVREVTGIREYSNASMSRIFPKEIT